MTNQLFRDYLDGKIPVSQFAKGGRIKPGVYFLPAGSFNPHTPTLRDLTSAINLTNWRVISGDWDTKTTDPRARALWARNHRNTGPAPEPLSERARVTRYKEKP